MYFLLLQSTTTKYPLFKLLLVLVYVRFLFRIRIRFQGYFKNILWSYVNCILMYQWV